MYQLKRRVRFYETDGMGVVYHGNYANWLEEARVEYLRSYGIVLGDWLTMGIVFPIVELHVKYRESARYDDEVTVDTYLVHADRAKMVFKYQVRRVSDGALLTVAETAGTFTRVDNGRIARLPKEQIAGLIAAAAKDKEAYHE